MLDEDGTQILVWGESGAGKSSLVEAVLKSRGQKRVRTRCEASTTYEQLLSSAFEKIEARGLTGSTNQDTQSIGGGTQIGGGPWAPASINANANLEHARTDNYAPVVGAQLTSEALAQRMGALDVVWLLEDFHKLSSDVRARVADTLKVFSDEAVDYPKLRIIMLGVAETAAQILQTPSNMRGRLADVPIPPLSDEQLGQVLNKGLELLKVDFMPVRDRIIRHSVGVATITHSLAKECCVALGVRETNREVIAVTDEAFTAAKAAYVRTRGGDMKELFDVAVHQPTTRRYQNYAIILEALASLPERGASHAQILARIHQKHPHYPAGNLTTYLRSLQSEERKSLVRKTSEGLFRFDAPLQHAYAMLRWGIDANSTSDSWAGNLAVSPAEREVSIRLAAEELDVPEELDGIPNDVSPQADGPSPRD